MLGAAFSGVNVVPTCTRLVCRVSCKCKRKKMAFLIFTVGLCHLS